MFQKLVTTSLLVLSVLVAANSTEAFSHVESNITSDLDSVCPDKTKEPCATAKKMIVSAAVIVTGEDLPGDDWTYAANKMLSSPETETKFKEGLNLGDAINFWKSWLASPFTGDGNRSKVINLAYLEVYGLLPLPIETKVWMERINAKQAWYTTIVSTEISGLNSAPARRRDMITRAYSHAFGRVPNDGEMNYWLPRTEHYRRLIDAQRAWLYSNNGTTDLHYAINKAWLGKYKKDASPSDIDTATKKFAVDRKIYIEMVKAL